MSPPRREVRREERGCQEPPGCETRPHARGEGRERKRLRRPQPEARQGRRREESAPEIVPPERHTPSGPAATIFGDDAGPAKGDRSRPLPPPAQPGRAPGRGPRGAAPQPPLRRRGYGLRQGARRADDRCELHGTWVRYLPGV